MATDISSMPVNGTFGTHMAYDQSSFNGAASQQQQAYNAASSSSAVNSAKSANSSTSEVPKDEVGWYFVEQYYTTLSRHPDKLYLFYNKRSQLVIGQETDKVDVCVGPRAINDRIKELNFQDCKIRVTNVDSQASDANIVIQVIGEISHKSQPHQKFTQTFILAGQTNGYFVLNDIFRYLIEEEDEDQALIESNKASSHQATASTRAKDSLAGMTSSTDKAEIDRSAQKVSEHIEEKTHAAPEPPAMSALATTNGTHHESPAAVPEIKELPVVTTSNKTDTPVDTTAAGLEAEKPLDPTPTPVMSPPKQNIKPAAFAPSATESGPPKPAAPKTWANLAAVAHKTNVPAPPTTAGSTQSATSPVPHTTRAQPSAASVSPAPSAQTVSASAGGVLNASGPTAQEPSPTDAQQQGGWTNVGGEHKRQQSKVQGQAVGATEVTHGRAYIKDVGEDVQVEALRKVLSEYGALGQVEISRQKGCAFVDFQTLEGYKAAIAKNPHTIGDSRLIVEERRAKSGPFPSRGGIRGGRGSPGQSTGRGGNGQGRGGFAPRGRGGAQSRGRGSSGVPAA